MNGLLPPARVLLYLHPVLNSAERYMQRCLDLALLGAGSVAPNPMVGAVLVHGDRIIGEGYHRQYGQAHAEVNCLESVKEEDRPLISQSTLYVTLEPCAHHGKTPPCADLIVRHQVPAVVVACRDPFTQVNGKGLEKLQAAGIQTTLGCLREEAIELNKRFFTFHVQKRPYVILKWAQTADGFIGHQEGERLLITNEIANRLVHKWRSEEASIMVGTQTALMDDPALTNLKWTGHSPVRIVLDRHLRLPAHLKLFRDQPTLVFNLLKEEEKSPIRYIQIKDGSDLIPYLLERLYQLNVQSVLVEGGRQLLQSWIDAGTWDEVRVLTNTNLTGRGNVKAPVLSNHRMAKQENIPGTLVEYFRPESLTHPLNFTF